MCNFATSKQQCGMEQRQLVGLITRRSLVRIRLPLLSKKRVLAVFADTLSFFIYYAFTSHLSGKNAKPLYYFYTQCCIHAMAQQREASTDWHLTFATRPLSLVLALPSVVRSPCNAQSNYWVYLSKSPWFWMKTVGVLVQKYGTFGCKVWWFLGREYCGLGKPIICFFQEQVRVYSFCCSADVACMQQRCNGVANKLLSV